MVKTVPRLFLYIPLVYVENKHIQMLHKIKWSHQYAVFNTIVYRLLNTPLEQTEYTQENEHILNTAATNCFDKKLVDKKITTFRKLKHIKEITTL